MAIPGGSMWSLSGYMTIGIWRMRNGAWELFTTRDVAVYESYTTGGTKTANWYLNETFQLGNDVTDVGVTIESSDGTSAITGMSATYQSQASGGERSATANGGAATAIVRP